MTATANPTRGANAGDSGAVLGLTPRQQEVFELMATGLTNREIAAQLEVSAETIKRHVSAILASLDVSNRTEAIGLYAPRAPAAVCQLPPLPRVFVGREEILAELCNKMRRRSGTACAIHGLGGAGKTALALNLATRVAAGFPAGCLYLDLRGTSEPETPRTAMLHVIRSLRPDHDPVDDAGVIAGLYRSLLRSAPVLLLMDNAAGHEQLEPLLPPDPSGIIVTSREAVTLPGLASIRIGRLEREDSRRLLRQISPRTDGIEDGMAELCGDLPLALVLAARGVDERPDVAPSEHLRRLADAPIRLQALDRVAPDRGIAASIRASYQMLARSTRGRLARLSVFCQDFDCGAAAFLWSVDAVTADREIGRLLAHSLLEWMPDAAGTARYRLHDLVQLFLSYQIGQSVERNTRLRHAGYYLNLLEDASTEYVESGSEQARCVAALDANWDNILAAFEWCARAVTRSDDAAMLCAGYPLGSALVSIRQHPQERARWCQVALEAAERVGDLRLQMKQLEQLGRARLDLAQIPAASSLFERALAIAGACEDRAKEGDLLVSSGVARSLSGDPHASRTLFRRALEIATEGGDLRRQAVALNNLGITYRHIGEPMRTIECCTRALALARERKDRWAESKALGNLGTAYRDMGEPRRALLLYERTLAISRELEDRKGEAAGLGNMGLVYHDMGDMKRAVSLSRCYLKLARDIGFRFGEGNALAALAGICGGTGHLARARVLWEHRIRLARSIDDRRGEALAGGFLSPVLERLGDIPGAVAAASSHYAYLQEIGHARAPQVALELQALRSAMEPDSDSAPVPLPRH